MSEKIGQTDSGKDHVLTGKDNKILSYQTPKLQYTVLGMFIIYRLLHDRDVKILITGKGKTTGTGKTTLAIILAKWVNEVRNEIFDLDQDWSAEGYSFMNVWEYLKKYKESMPGDPLITDELEYMADKRRHQTHENVKFSQAWSILRYKNAVTIGTAPGLSDLEKRVIETADIWINVIHTGKANTYYLTFDDFEWKPIYRRLRQGRFKESICWDEIENDPDYQWLKNRKEDLGVPGLDDKDDKQEITEKDLNEQERKLKNSTVKELLKKLHANELHKTIDQGDVAEIAGVSQQQVSVLKQELEKNNELEP